MNQKQIAQKVNENVSGKTRCKKVRRPRGSWTESEDEALRRAVERYGAKQWRTIAQMVPNRSHVQCLHRWQKVLDPELIKGPWTKEEDERVLELVRIFGLKKWSLIAAELPGRIGKQCRERWTNHLDPSLKKGNWEEFEDEIILKTQNEVGNKWAYIARLLPGRSDNAVKNRFYSTLSRKKESVKSVRKNSKKKKVNVKTEQKEIFRPASLVEYIQGSNQNRKATHAEKVEPTKKKIRYHVDVIKQEEEFDILDSSYYLGDWSLNLHPTLLLDEQMMFFPQDRYQDAQYEPELVDIEKYTQYTTIEYAPVYNELIWNEGY